MITGGEQAKQTCRNQSMVALKKGIIIKPACCPECGGDTRLYMHHDDYNKPFDIRWMCPKCHHKHHKENISPPAPVHVGRELRAKPQRNYVMPEVIRQKLEETGDTIKDWCSRRRLKTNTVYKLFSGETLGLFGESCRAKRYLDMHFIGWDKDLHHPDNDTFKHLKFQKHERFSDVLKRTNVKL